METNRKQWIDLHTENRYRPKYPSETVVQYVFRNFERNGKTKVLDLGCGAGRHVVFIGRENIIPYGVDFSDEGIEYTKQVLKATGMECFVDNMQVAPLTNLPYEDNMFDGIVCYGVLYYLPMADIKKAIDEIKRVLKPNGKVMLEVRNTEDYRCGLSTCLPTEESNTFIINEDDSTKCAHSENGMLMHFFTETEIKELFSDFTHLTIDRITETHNNGAFCDSNFIVMANKGED